MHYWWGEVSFINMWSRLTWNSCLTGKFEASGTQQVTQFKNTIRSVSRKSRKLLAMTNMKAKINKIIIKWLFKQSSSSSQISPKWFLDITDKPTCLFEDAYFNNKNGFREAWQNAPWAKCTHQVLICVHQKFGTVKQVQHLGRFAKD